MTSLKRGDLFGVEEDLVGDHFGPAHSQELHPVIAVGPDETDA